MKLRKRTKDYVASNVWFDPNAMEATSYRWYHVVKRINGLIVFNEYFYSNSTIKHIYKIRRVMSSLGIKSDLSIEAPQGLSHLDSAIRLYQNRITDLKALISKPKTRKAKNQERAEMIKFWESKILTVQKLMEAAE